MENKTNHTSRQSESVSPDISIRAAHNRKALYALYEEAENGSLKTGHNLMEVLKENPQLLADMLAEMLQTETLTLNRVGNADHKGKDAFLEVFIHTGQKPFHGWIKEVNHIQSKIDLLETTDPKESCDFVIVLTHDMDGMEEEFRFDGPIARIEAYSDGDFPYELILVDLNRLQQMSQDIEELDQMQNELESLFEEFLQAIPAGSESAGLSEFTMHLIQATSMQIVMALCRLEDMELEEAIRYVARDHAGLYEDLSELFLPFSSAQDFFDAFPEGDSFEELMEKPSAEARESIDAVIDEIHANLEGLELGESARQAPEELSFMMDFEFEDPEMRRLFEKAGTISNRAVILALHGQEREAASLFSQAEQLFVQLFRQSGVEELRYAIAFNIFIQIQNLYFNDPAYSDLALKMYNRAAKWLDKAPENPARDLLKSQIYGDYGLYLLMHEEDQQGIARIFQAIDLAKKAYERNPEEPQRDQVLELFMNVLSVSIEHQAIDLSKETIDDLRDWVERLLFGLEPAEVDPESLELYLHMLSFLNRIALNEGSIYRAAKISNTALSFCEQQERWPNETETIEFLDTYLKVSLDMVMQDKMEAIPVPWKNKLLDRIEDFLRLMRHHPEANDLYGFEKKRPALQDARKKIRNMPVL